MSSLPSYPPDKVIADYIWWMGESYMDLRSIAIGLDGPVRDLSMLPARNYYDGPMSICLYPQAIFKDPFRRGENILVMCDAYTQAGEPIATNNRHAAAEIFSHPDVVAEVPWYRIGQEYTLLQRDVNWPIGLPVGGYPGRQGPYYGGIGADRAFGRDIARSHYEACLYAGINIGGIEGGGVMPGQWKFQVAAVGISAGDELWVARYILARIAESAGAVLASDARLIQGVRNGAGLRIDYSTESFRNDGGHEAIRKAKERIRLRAEEQIWASYFSGCRETADINMDPYVVTPLIAETTILWKPYYELAWERVWLAVERVWRAVVG